MKPELAILSSARLGHLAAAQDAVTFPWVPPGNSPSPTPFPTPTPTIPNVGMFGTPGSLPTNPGPVEPDWLNQGPAGGYPSPTPGNNSYGHTGFPGYSNIIALLDRYSPGWDQGTGWPGGERAGYTPSNIVQAYMDFYNNMGNLRPAGVMGPADPNYPAPGAGAARPPDPSVLSRIVGNIPAVRLVRLLGQIFNRPQSWRDNARSNPRAVQPGEQGSGPAGAADPGAGVGRVPALFGYNPNSGGGGGTPRFDFTTGRTTTTPSTNPLYNTGSGWVPVANAPVDVRWAQNSGTGNWQADQATKNFLLSGGYPGPVNSMGTTRDRGHDRNYGIQRMTVDEFGGMSPLDFGDDPNGNTATSQALYQQAMRAVPMDRTGYSLQYVQRLNDWIRANQPASFNQPAIGAGGGITIPFRPGAGGGGGDEFITPINWMPEMGG